MRGRVWYTIRALFTPGRRFPAAMARQSLEKSKIRFLLLENSDVTLRIFSLAGELVRSRWNRNLSNLDGSSSGTFYYYTWDGTNDNGDRVLNGVYLCVIQIKGASGKSSSRVDCSSGGSSACRFRQSY